jgi:mono/diheme cytochrome c family protein
MKHLSLLVLSLMSILFYSCSKGGGSTNTPTDPCAGITIAISGTVTNATSGQNNGSIAAGATGGTGFTFSLNNGSFQSSGNFSNLAPGNYNITAKNSNGCSGTKSFTVVAENNCSGVNITVNGTATNGVPCGGTGGTISITATGGTGFTYSVNNSAFQASNQFTNLAVGTYTVVAKNADGCSNSATVKVDPVAPGALFTAVKNILQTNCVSCHNNTLQNGGMNWAVDCNIVTNKARIKARAVDQAGTATQMPQPPNPALSAADQQKIVDWINAGGGYNN